MKKLLSALFSSVFMLCMLSSTLLASESSISERERNLQIIENFLKDPSIHEAMAQKHGKDVDALMKKISKLGDWELGKLAKHTPDLLQYGGATDTTYSESRTAERISGQWLNVAYLAILVPVALVLLVILAF